MVEQSAHNGLGGGSTPSPTTTGGSATTTNRVYVWHEKGGWKRMEVISSGYKWVKLKYIGKNRYLKLPKGSNRIQKFTEKGEKYDIV